jgi:hypothetical protein
MGMLLIIFGILLALFGGGCTLILGGAMVGGGNFTRDFQDMGIFLLVFGLFPLLVGVFLIRVGTRMNASSREQRAHEGEREK